MAVASLKADEPRVQAPSAISPDRALYWLNNLGALWRKASPAERAELVASVYSEIRVRGREIIAARLTPDAYANGLALALPEMGNIPEWVLARPTGVGRALAAYEIPIEGRDEWLAAAGKRLA